MRQEVIHVYQRFKTYCMSLYGVVLWDLSGKRVEQFFVAWWKCIRRFFRLPMRTHSRLLPLLCEDLPVNVQLHARFLNFFFTLRNSSNSLVRFISSISINDSQSEFSKSITYICRKYNLSKYNLNDRLTNINVIKNVKYDIQDEIISGSIIDLMRIR